MCHVPRSDGREDLLCRRDGPVDVLLGVRQGGEARLVLRGCQVDALTAAGLPKFPLSRYCRYGIDMADMGVYENWIIIFP